MFANLAVDDVLNNLERDGLAVRPENDPAAVQRVLPLEAFSREIRRSAMRALPRISRCSAWRMPFANG